MATETMTGAKIVFQALVDQGVDVIFGYPGGAVLPLYDELIQQNRIRHILVRHEQAALHAAEGYARATGKVGCALVTSGPGATNAVTGLLDALCDSTPLVCLTGQVPTHLIGNDAFQEADTTGITRPCTKHNYLVRDVADLARTLHEAFLVAKTGRPGPVVVDLPKNVLLANGSYAGPAKVRHKTYRPSVKAEPTAIKAAVDLMEKAERPIFYVGGGVVNAGPEACRQLTDFVRETGFPCTQTLMGLGAYPGADAQSLGMVGMHGTLEANLAMHGCDLVICVGARFDDRVTGRLDAFSPGSRKIHVDIDPSSINKTVAVDVALVADAGEAVADLAAEWRARAARPCPDAMGAWWARIDGWRKRDCLAYDQGTGKTPIKPQAAIERLRTLTRGRDVYLTTEVGQHQMWAAQFFTVEEPRRLITSGGLGTMGFGLPAAVGAQIAHPDALVIDLAGEGSILMNIQEMATIVQYGLPVKVFILNNRYLGMVRQWQELLHESRYSETFMPSQPDFVKLAEAFGAKGIRIDEAADLDDGILAMLAEDGPVIVDCRVDPAENCLPMIPSGAAHNEMILKTGDRAAPPISEGGMVLV